MQGSRSKILKVDIMKLDLINISNIEWWIIQFMYFLFFFYSWKELELNPPKEEEK